ncbi:Tn3 family transposase [Nonomuraea bangladeshensis]|uniref:Tn3 family transposase n=1 Tax=Nonomuraea bangladeshensis TaxID=404385 RepID=A0ABV3HDF6_9ACTN
MDRPSNGANSVIFYGKGGDIATNRREELEMSMLCLRILQAALVYINALMLQDVLADPEWVKLLKPADRRGLTPLFWQHVQPYGEVRLDVAKRLPLGSTARAPKEGNPGGEAGVEVRSRRCRDRLDRPCLGPSHGGWCQGSCWVVARPCSGERPSAPAEGVCGGCTAGRGRMRACGSDFGPGPGRWCAPKRF